MTITLKRSELDAMGIEDGRTGERIIEVKTRKGTKKGVICPKGAGKLGVVLDGIRLCFWAKPAAVYSDESDVL